MKMRIMTAALLSCFICSSGWGAEKESQKKAFVYKTNVGWHKTGITVRAGQKIKIKARGSWSPDGKMKLTAHGIMEDRWISYSISPKIAHGRMMAYISDKPGEYYNIGASKTFKAKSNGELVIGVNDNDVSNNTGTLDITITY